MAQRPATQKSSPEFTRQTELSNLRVGAKVLIRAPIAPFSQHLVFTMLIFSQPRSCLLLTNGLRPLPGSYMCTDILFTYSY